MLAEAERLLSERLRSNSRRDVQGTAADRQLALALAARRGVPVLFIECVVSEEEAIRRLEQRGSIQGEVSDATPEGAQEAARRVRADSRASAAQITCASTPLASVNNLSRKSRMRSSLW